MSPKLSPPGVAVLPINYQFPQQLGPLVAFSIVALHAGGTVSNLAHGGLHNPVMSWSIAQAHLDLLAEETKQALKAWLAQDRRVVAIGVAAVDRQQQDEAEVMGSEIMQEVHALQAFTLEAIKSIQEKIKAKAAALQAAKDGKIATNGNLGHVEVDESSPIVQ